MTAVSDASPLISLAAIGQLDLLFHLFETVVIPDQVLRELDRGGAGRPGSASIQEASWLSVRTVRDQTLVETLTSRLHLGEAETLALALQLEAGIVLVDEKRARGEAAKLGLSVIGVLGVLLAAKEQGLVSAVRPLLLDLRDRASFRIHPDLFLRALQQAGES